MLGTWLPVAPLAVVFAFGAAGSGLLILLCWWLLTLAAHPAMATNGGSTPSCAPTSWRRCGRLSLPALLPCAWRGASRLG